VLPANHLPLLRNRKIEKEKTNVETIMNFFYKKIDTIVGCEIEADKVNNSFLVSLPSNLRQKKAQEFQIDKQSKVATQKKRLGEPLFPLPLKTRKKIAIMGG
jgi:hypothetical protein